MHDYTKKFVGIIKDKYNECNSMRQTAKELKLSRYMVKRIISASPSDLPSCGRKSYSDTELNALQNILNSDSTLYLVELASVLYYRTGYNASRATICRMTKELRITRQRILDMAHEKFSPVAMERRMRYLAEVSMFPVNALYFVDECGIRYSHFLRSMARGYCGCRPRRLVPYTYKQKINLLSCIGSDGFVSYRIIKEETHTVDFNHIILEVVIPHIPMNSVVILDNASFHQCVNLEAAVRLTGRHLLFLPPYSPDLNPIEISYGWLKRQLQGQICKKSIVDLVASIAFTYSQIEKRHTQAWFKRCMYFIE